MPFYRKYYNVLDGSSWCTYSSTNPYVGVIPITKSTIFNFVCIGKCISSHINKIQIFQNKYNFKIIANAMFYNKRKFT